jgi:hypothetical protein
MTYYGFSSGDGDGDGQLISIRRRDEATSHRT